MLCVVKQLEIPFHISHASIDSLKGKPVVFKHIRLAGKRLDGYHVAIRHTDILTKYIPF